MPLNFQEIQRSPFRNTYGSLLLVEGSDGNKYLAMQDCGEPDYFGPLTTEQVTAFKVLTGAVPFTDCKDSNLSTTDDQEWE
jgi:hypothetical protein